MPGIRDLGVVVAFTLASMTAMGGTPHLTLDINTQVQPRSSLPVFLGKLGSSTYFSANTTPGAIGAALFATDGTSDGTIRVKDIAGLGVLANLSSLLEYQSPPLFFSAGAKAYFTPLESATGEEVWVTDGTPAGTHIVEDLYPGQGGDPLMLGVIGTDLIFFESTSETNRQIFKTDGTAAGTLQLSNFPPLIVNVSDGYQYARDPVTINGKVYFGLDSINGEQDLWVTDGTSAGTSKLGNVPSPWNIEPSSLAAFGNSLLFIGFDPSSGTVLYELDTATDIPHVLAGAQFNGSDQKTIAVMDGYALFVGSGSQLWKTDGTAGGTVAITNFSMPSNGTPPLGFQDTAITRVGSHAVFLAWGSQNDRYLWGTDGTAAGTVQLIASPSPTGADPGIVQTAIGVVGNYGYFVVPTASGDEIVVTDGTVVGTHVLIGIGPINAQSPNLNVVAGTDSLAFIEVLDMATPANHALYSYAPQTNTLTKLRQAPASGQIAQLSYDSGHVFFDSTDPVTGNEPWISDGTVAGTHLLKNVMPESLTDDSDPASLVAFGGKVAFLANDGLNDSILWISDGTAAGTTLLPNVTLTNNANFPSKLIGANGALYVFGFGADNQYHFMRIAQPGDAPQTLADLAPPDYRTSPWSTVLNGELYFVASTNNQNALYKTDGTASGTVAVTDQSLGAPNYLYTIGNKIFFLANTSTGQQLFSTDGTSAGTVQLSQATNFASVGGGSTLPVLNGAVYFTTTDASNNVQFWKTDGTAAGTVATASFPATNGMSSRPLPVAAVNGKLLVQTVPPNAQGAPLFVSDGTGANTTPLNTPFLGYNATVTVIGSKAYFSASNANGGFDPWVTDGTQAGTYMLTSVADVQFATVVWFMDFNGVTVFEVSQGLAGSLLYQTDGTQAGTKLIGPIGTTPNTGIQNNGYPREHLVVGQNLFFPAVDPSAGAELFVMTNNPPVAMADTATSDNDAAVTINVLANDTDSDGSLNPSTVQITTNPAHGSVTVGAGGSVTYTPTAGYSGQDTFAYTVADNQGAVSAPAQVTVTVTPSVTISTGDSSGSGSGGGGGSMSYTEIVVLMALMLHLSGWRLRRGRLAKLRFR